jgi:peptidoglycan/LPS O-acetylase OafA/YrhL
LHRKDIQALRAVAVLLVILMHAGIAGFRVGFIGVDIFFVISGYVITGYLLNLPDAPARFQLQTFYIRRILRIVPAASIVLIATILITYFSLKRKMDPALIGDVRWANLFSANFRFIQENASYEIAGVAPSLVTHYWSLAVEEQFYLLYPAIFFLATYKKMIRFTLIPLQITLISVIVISSWWSWRLTTMNPTAAYYSPFTRFWELALGALLVTITPKLRSASVGSTMKIVGTILIVGALLVKAPVTSFPGLLAWIPSAGAALILFSGKFSERDFTRKVFEFKPLLFIGDISYSLYLWHFVWLVLPTEINNHLHGAWITLAEVIGMICCALASYYWLENPIRTSALLKKDTLSTALLLLVCLVLVWDCTIFVARLIA